MATEETNIVNTIMKDVSPSGVRIFRNTRGVFYTLDSVKGLIAAAMSLNIARIKSAAAALRQVAAGLLAAGASDLIGFKPVLITQEMVGTTLAVFVAMEVKTATGRASPEQAHFVEFVNKNGGLAGIVRSSEDAKSVLKITD